MKQVLLVALDQLVTLEQQDQQEKEIQVQQVIQAQPVQLVLSTAPNPKVTRPEDLPCVEAVLRDLAARV